MSTAYHTLEVNHETNGILRITLSRPDKLNALNQDRILVFDSLNLHPVMFFYAFEAFSHLLDVTWGNREHGLLHVPLAGDCYIKLFGDSIFIHPD